MNTSSDRTLVSEEQHQELRHQVRRIIEAEGLTVAAAAKDAGVAYTTFHAYLQGTYTGNNGRVGAEVERWLRSREDRRQATRSLPVAPSFQMTQTAERLQAVLQYAQYANDIAIIAGGPGIGKTITCQHYRDENPNVWMVTIEPTTATTNGLLRELCTELGLTERDNAKLARAICGRIDGTRGLLIIDEAQHLDTKALDQLRAIHDRTAIGIVMVGNESVYTRLEGGGRRAEFAQLYSRVGMRHTQAGPRPADVDVLADRWDVTAEERKLLQAIARKPGALRGMTKTLALASMIAHGAGIPRNADHVRQAWAKLAPDERLFAA